MQNVEEFLVGGEGVVLVNGIVNYRLLVNLIRRERERERDIDREIFIWLAGKGKSLFNFNVTYPDYNFCTEGLCSSFHGHPNDSGNM